jgi:hypothetical protein
LRARKDHFACSTSAGKVHLAPEFTVVAIACLDRTRYKARPLLVLPHCSKGTKDDQKELLTGIVDW